MESGPPPFVVHAAEYPRPESLNLQGRLDGCAGSGDRKAL